MSASGPLTIATRQQMREHLTTLAGRRYSWGHLAIKHNSLEHVAPCRFCDGPAKPAEGPAIFWDTDALCPDCAGEIAPELSAYLTHLACCDPPLGRGLACLVGARRAATSSLTKHDVSPRPQTRRGLTLLSAHAGSSLAPQGSPHVPAVSWPRLCKHRDRMKNYRIVVRYRRSRPFAVMQHLCSAVEPLFTLCGYRLYFEPGDGPPDVVGPDVLTWLDITDDRDLCRRCIARAYADLPSIQRDRQRATVVHVRDASRERLS